MTQQLGWTRIKGLETKRYPGSVLSVSNGHHCRGRGPDVTIEPGGAVMGVIFLGLYMNLASHICISLPQHQ